MCFLYLFGRYRLMCYLCFGWSPKKNHIKRKTKCVTETAVFAPCFKADPPLAACIGDTFDRDRRNARKKTRKQDTAPAAHRPTKKKLYTTRGCGIHSVTYIAVYIGSHEREYIIQHLKCYLPLTHRSTVIQRFLVLSSSSNSLFVQQYCRIHYYIALSIASCQYIHIVNTASEQRTRRKRERARERNKNG